MRKVGIVTAAAATLALGACGAFPGIPRGGGDRTVEAPSPSVATRLWRASLAPRGGSVIRGTAILRELPGETRAEVSISNAPPNDLLPWHVHDGTCGSPGPIVPEEHRYTLLVTDATGQSNLAVGLRAGLVGEGSHYVDVHRSRGDRTVIACGDLTQEAVAS